MAHRRHEVVARRAGHRCEYCHLPSIYSQLRFVCDHIIAKKHGGSDELENLALSCPHCNSHKLDNIAGLDFALDAPIRLFNPRRDLWFEHFQLESGHIAGRTSIGRATVKVLAINSMDRVRSRRALLAEGVVFD